MNHVFAVTLIVFNFGFASASEEEASVEAAPHGHVTCCAEDQCRAQLSFEECDAWLRALDDAEDAATPTPAPLNVEGSVGGELDIARPIAHLRQTSIIIVGDCHTVYFPRGTHERLLGEYSDCLVDVVKQGTWAFDGERILIQAVVIGPHQVRKPVDYEWLAVLPLNGVKFDGRTVAPLAQPLGAGVIQ